MIRVCLAGGGTGGHISPAIAISEALQRKDGCECFFVATHRLVDRRMYAPYGSRVHYMDSPRLDTGGKGARLLLPLRGLSAVLRARRLLRAERADLVLATGGYSSFYSVLAAKSMGLPVMIHDSNSVPGRSNRVAALVSDLVMVGFQGACSYFRGACEFTGNPVRYNLRRINPLEARGSLGLSPELPVVLFLGGSQGARSLNDLALQCPDDLQVLLQSGRRNGDRVRDLASDRRNVRIFDFVDDPSEIYSAADVAVARAGAMTIAELAWFRLPSVLIPYPHAADAHQLKNAAEVAVVGGAYVLRQSQATGVRLWRVVQELLEDAAKRKEMSMALIGLMPENPAAKIARRIIRACWRPAV
jgi:UDP-N-acetylglucosamine--N-acetylmuramyl-(pentapeptide) pyrophosphoryl-undecaprenol N-acetylglucosamine transferase